MCAQVHSAGSSEHTMHPGLLQLIMCDVQNCLPSVHLLYSLMPNLIAYPWFHRQINFLVCFFGPMSNSVTLWHPLLFPPILQSTAPGSRLRFKSENDVLYFSVLQPIPFDTLKLDSLKLQEFQLMGVDYKTTLKQTVVPRPILSIFYLIVSFVRQDCVCR